MAPYLGPIQVVRLHIGWLVSLRLLGEGNGCTYKAEERKEKHLKPWDNKQIWKKVSSQTRINTLTGLWIRCSSSWAGNQNWAPRRRGAWFVHRERRHCGWPRGTWRQSCPASCAWTGADGLVCWSPAATPTPVQETDTSRIRKIMWTQS